MITLYIAHIRQSDGEQQLLQDHLKGAQYLAEKFGLKLGIPHITGLAGMLHDMGKYSDAFQGYLRDAVENPDAPPKRGSVDHSTAGGKFLMEEYHQQAKGLIECIANAIYSHHGQLKDMVNSDGDSPFGERKDYRDDDDLEYEEVKERFFSEMYSRKYVNEYVLKAKQELNSFVKEYLRKTFNSSQAPREKVVKEINSILTFLTKYVFSSLLDADRTNTRLFEENDKQDEKYKLENIFVDFEERLENKLNELQRTSVQNDITELRQYMSDICAKKADLPADIYTLSIPTGGGKTLTSLRFALKHARKHHKERIIYVVPFTTIIEQNASEVRNILKANDYVLEHHSNIIEENVENDEFLPYEEYQRKKRLKIAKDNWDVPIIFTTMVQFLDTFYKGKSRNTRRLHNLANSIIIFDEIQSLPIKCVSLFNRAISFLKNGANATILLCTATQPALEYVQNNIAVKEELIEDLPRIINAFKRTTIVNQLKTSGWDTEKLALFVKKQLESINSVLIILNTKKVVNNLFHQLQDLDAKVVHLSTSMCAAHRKEIISDVRKTLKKGEKIICVSTQLIEAGVDVSFECVIRSVAGLDSIAQAAGRCNRHGEVKNRNVYIINHAEEKLKMLPTIKIGGEISENILKDIEQDSLLFDGNILSAEAIQNYFQNFYRSFEPILDYPTPIGENIYEMLFGENTEFTEEYGDFPFSIHASFETSAKYFNVIDSQTYTVLVPYEEGKEMIADLEDNQMIQDVSSFIRKAQQYSVNVFDQDLQLLIKNHQLEMVDFGYAKLYIAKENAYSKKYGMNYEGEARVNLLAF